MSPKSHQRRGAIQLALNQEQQDEFCAYLRTVPDLKAKTVARLCKERYGVSVGINAAWTFMQGPFAEDLRRIRQRRAKHVLIKEARDTGDTAVTSAESATGILADFLEDFADQGGLDAIDLTDPNGVKHFANLTLALKRLGSEDRSNAELREKLAISERLRGEANAKAKAAAVAVDELTQKKAVGLSITARNAIRLEQGLPPLEETDTP